MAILLVPGGLDLREMRISVSILLNREVLLPIRPPYKKPGWAVLLYMETFEMNHNPHGETTSGKVLVIDDDDVIRNMIQEICRDQFSMECDTAADFQTGKRLFSQGNYILAITDILLPDGSGVNLLKHFKQSRSLAGVIVITGLSGEYSYVDIVEAGANDFLVKPFSVQELQAKMKRVLNETLLRFREQALIESLRHRIEEGERLRLQVAGLQDEVANKSTALEQERMEIQRLREKLRQAPTPP